VRSIGLTGVPYGRLPETSKRRTRGIVAWVALVLRRLAVDAHPSDGATTRFPKVPFGGVYPSIM
jgi:hypothetical protein